MKCCVSTDVVTWMNLLIFGPDPDHSPDAGTGLLSPISYMRCYADFYVGKIPPSAPLQRAVALKWFYLLSCRNTSGVATGGTGGARAPQPQSGQAMGFAEIRGENF